jgi:hypothetical protein
MIFRLINILLIISILGSCLPKKRLPRPNRFLANNIDTHNIITSKHPIIR